MLDFKFNVPILDHVSVKFKIKIYNTYKCCACDYFKKLTNRDHDTGKYLMDPAECLTFVGIKVDPADKHNILQFSGTITKSHYFLGFIYALGKDKSEINSALLTYTLLKYGYSIAEVKHL